MKKKPWAGMIKQKTIERYRRALQTPCTEWTGGYKCHLAGIARGWYHSGRISSKDLKYILGT